MSYFLFGALTLESSIKENGELAWKVAECAISSRLFILMGPNLHQNSVLEMLRAHGLLTEFHLPFLLTGAPQLNTSEELLGNFHLSPDNSESIENSLNRMKQWVKKIASIQGIKGLNIFLVDGSDTDFENLHVSSKQLSELIISKIRMDGEIPSLRIQVVAN